MTYAADTDLAGAGYYEEPESPRSPLRIALMGTRGVPARYGGFETAVEEVGRRLVAKGHEVTVYCRSEDRSQPQEHLGMHLVHLPALRRKALETLSHTGVSTGHAIFRRRPDVAIVFNAANAPFLPVLRARGIPVATHVDGLEWKRSKWGGAGRRYYLRAESLAVRWSDALIADAQGIVDYYAGKFGVRTRLLTYGAPILTDAGSERLAELDLDPGRFHLVVARFEPENHVDLAVEGYLRSDARFPLVVVGSAPYANAHIARIRSLANQDERVRLIGAVWDQGVLDQLYTNALTYVHGHSVGGTNPSLLRAIGAGTAVCAYDVEFNREVLGSDGTFFDGPDSLAGQVSRAECEVPAAIARGHRLQDRARRLYRWDDVADGYESLCVELAGRGALEENGVRSIAGEPELSLARSGRQPLEELPAAERFAETAHQAGGG